MFYMFYESQEAPANATDTPIVLWLQGGPGAASARKGVCAVGLTTLQGD